MAPSGKPKMYRTTLTFYPARLQKDDVKEEKEETLSLFTQTSVASQTLETEETDKTPLVSGSRHSTNRKDKICFYLLLLINIFVGISYSLQAPFYSIEGFTEGVSASISGFVFGVFQLVIFLLSPVFGKFIHQIGANLLINAGNFTMAISLVLFGLLPLISDVKTFIALSFTARIVEAIGCAAFITAAYSVCAQHLSQGIPAAFSFLLSAYVIGMIIGPACGGYLYEVGGFTLPFALIGALIMLTAIVIAIILPKTDVQKATEKGFVRLLKNPSILISCFSFVIVNFTFGFLASSLESHVRRFHVRPLLLGLLFIVSGTVCVISNRLWGFYAATRYKDLKLLSGKGALVIIVAFIFIGPLPFLPFEANLWTISVCLAIFGVGIGAELLVPFLDAIQEAVRISYPNNIETYGLVAGMWSSMSALGQFLGPTIAGVLLDSIGFRNATLIIIALHFLVVFLSIGFSILKKYPQLFRKEN